MSLSLYPELQQWKTDLARIRHDLHQHPQTAFEETYASDLIARKLTEWGVDFERGWAKTGIVATIPGRLEAQGALKSIGLRADIDALDIPEATGLPYASVFPGKMHACGHDGHTTMLLGAVRYLASTRNFSGTVRCIFQPAEENEGGGRVMVEEGLFDRHPVDAVFGMHNWPGMPEGNFAVAAGPVMAAFDIFEILVHGCGGHAAKPHQTHDPIVVASQIVSALQTIVSRQVNPHDQAVVSVTQIHAGDTWNVIPQSAVIRGTVRTFRKEVQDHIETSLTQIAHGIAEAMGTTATVGYERRYPATVNTPTETGWCAEVAETIAGAEHVDQNPEPSMGGEDFSFMLQKRPGCYIWVGNGSSEGQRLLHNPHYDFNDNVLPIGASYWVRLAETLLPVSAKT